MTKKEPVRVDFEPDKAALEDTTAWYLSICRGDEPPSNSDSTIFGRRSPKLSFSVSHGRNELFPGGSEPLPAFMVLSGLIGSMRRARPYALDRPESIDLKDGGLVLRVEYPAPGTVRIKGPGSGSQIEADPAVVLRASEEAISRLRTLLRKEIPRLADDAILGRWMRGVVNRI